MGIYLSASGSRFGIIESGDGEGSPARMRAMMSSRTTASAALDSTFGRRSLTAASNSRVKLMTAARPFDSPLAAWSTSWIAIASARGAFRVLPPSMIGIFFVQMLVHIGPNVLGPFRAAARIVGLSRFELALARRALIARDMIVLIAHGAPPFPQARAQQSRRRSRHGPRARR